MAAGFDVSTIDAYNDESGALVAKAILEAQNLTMGVTLIPGIKSGVTYKLNKVDEAITPKAAGCSFSATGATTLSQNDVKAVGFQVDNSYCPETLFPTYLSQRMKAGASQEDFPESQFIADLVMKNIKAFNDELMWNGSVIGGDLMDGWITLLTADATRVQEVTINQGAMTTANVDDVVDNIYAKFVTEVPELLTATDLVMVMAPEWFAAYTKQLRDANLFNYGTADTNFVSGVKIPGTNVTVKSLNGLSGTKNIVMTSAANLAVVIDGISDTDGLSMWYSKDNQEVRAVAKWALGVGYFYADQIVCNF